MKVVSTSDMRLLDQRAILKYGMDSLVLMKNAAHRIKAFIDERFEKDEEILIACGPGNNGGDGFALAIELKCDHYHNITVVCPVEQERMSKDERYYAELAQTMGINITQGQDLHTLRILLNRQDVIVDALFGTGLSRDITGYYADLIDLINDSDAFVLCVDIASGIHSDLGCVMHTAIHGDVTITFECATFGQFIYPGSEYCGRLLIRSIGIAKEAFEGMDTYDIVNDAIAHTFLPKRYAHSHKGSYGKVLLVGGSRSMHGALALTAKSMLRSGVGLLTLFIPDAISDMTAAKMNECMLMEADSEQGYFHEHAYQLLHEHIKEYDVIVIGNGMGRGKGAKHLIEEVLNSDKPCVIDGDGLYLCKDFMQLLQQRKADTILTPHPKEMSYLMHTDIKLILQDPFTMAGAFTKTYPNVTLVLKDQYTLIQQGTKGYLNIAGNHALAKGGSGDVLCGIISGLFAQGRKALESAVCGVYVHALCADERLLQEDANSILPSDLISTLSTVYKRLR